MSRRSRFSRRHLLALCTFLVPLAVLAVIGNSELQRSGSQARAAHEAEAEQFLARAKQAIEQQFDRVVGPLMIASEDVFAGHLEREPAESVPATVIRTTLELRADPRFSALRHVVLLDEALALPGAWQISPTSLSLPFARDARVRGGDTRLAATLQATDLLLARGDHAAASELLAPVVKRLDDANGPARDNEVQAHFRFATVLQALGRREAAEARFEKVQALVRGSGGRLDADTAALSLLAELALAEAAGTPERLRLLRSIAEGRRSWLHDGLLTAIAERLATAIGEDAAARSELATLMAEERQRSSTRTFGADYDALLKATLRARQRLAKLEEGSAGAAPLHVYSTDADGDAGVLHVRAATLEEAERMNCAYIGLHLDLGAMLAGTLPQFTGGDPRFTLAVHAPENAPVAAEPTHVPDDYVPLQREVRGLSLRAFPADPGRLVAEAAASARNRTLLILALFATAVGGALWLWRSVSREAELASLKVDLVSRVSHELKTPLALIRMYGETLGMGRARDEEQAAQFGGIIARESERLTVLIQRILDFSRQQAGTLQYASERVDLASLLRSVCEAYTPHLEARGAILVETLPPDVFADCDPNAFESAVVNLLENAAKYAIEGDDEQEIELELRVQGGTAVVEVRDRGRGIPDGEWERVFDSFYRASNAGEVRGAGLGLSLVRHFARAHGGDATAAARDGGGAVFRITLPTAPAPAGDTAAPDRRGAFSQQAHGPTPEPT